MSYGQQHRGGRRRHGNGRGHEERWDHDAYEAFETPGGRLRTDIIRLGEVDPEQELPRLAKQLQEVGAASAASAPTLAEGFRIGVTEQPYKISYYAALLCHLYEPNSDDSPPLGKLILDDFCKGFRAFLDRLAWRETRLCIHFFAHLTAAGVITASSMSALLLSFIAVLEEFGGSHGRAKRAALCVVEGLMIAGPVLKTDPTTDISDMITAVQTYVDSMVTSKHIVQPMVRLHTESASVENVDEIVDMALSALRSLQASEFDASIAPYPTPYLSLVKEESPRPPTFDLPSVLVPPEAIELDGLATESGEDAPPLKKDEWAEFYVRLFDSDVTPDPCTPVGYGLRQTLLDTIDIFEVNRKECARLLLEFPKWTIPGTFRPRPGVPADVKPIIGRDWQLESTIVETILGTAFLLPEPVHKSLYYISLITELCKLSPSTVGPAVGKAIRRLYNALADGLDVEVGRRFAEWFAVHMSNFGFQWVWKEWVPDLSLSVGHPKRVFMLRAIEFEIRLSYYDRIMKTLPESFHDPAMRAIPEQAPGPDFEFDDPEKPHHEAAQAILGDLRGRAKAEDVIGHLESIKSNLIESGEETAQADTALRTITVQALLHIGSRSFSHFLNAIERYLPLLRSLTSAPSLTGADVVGSGHGVTEARADILTAASRFWKHNGQMVAIVFDKLMQYQIVGPTDVVAWTFGPGAGVIFGTNVNRQGLTAPRWDLLKGALDKANGRVVVARKRVSALRKEEDERRARAKASGGGDVASMEVDAEPKQEEPETPADSPALTTALKAFVSLTREQKAALSAALGAFVTCLSDNDANPSARNVIMEKAWHNRANWSEEEWGAWETWAWYRHFCRLYSPYLRGYSNTLGTVAFAEFEGSADPAVELLKKIWNVAILEA